MHDACTGPAAVVGCAARLPPRERRLDAWLQAEEAGAARVRALQLERDQLRSSLDAALSGRRMVSCAQGIHRSTRPLVRAGGMRCGCRPCAMQGRTSQPPGCRSTERAVAACWDARGAREASTHVATTTSSAALLHTQMCAHVGHHPVAAGHCVGVCVLRKKLVLFHIVLSDVAGRVVRRVLL
jgi:hypothetical protein